MKKDGLEPKKFITLELRPHSPSSPGVDDKRPQKLNPLHPTPENIAEDVRRANVYQDLIKETGWKVVIAPEVNKEMEYNKKLVYNPLPDDLKKHVVNFDEFWNVATGAFFHKSHRVFDLGFGSWVVLQRGRWGRTSSVEFHRRRRRRVR